MRNITNADLWSAIRGLGMYRMDETMLRSLFRRHTGNPLFASQVIAQAAAQVLAGRRA